MNDDRYNEESEFYCWVQYRIAEEKLGVATSLGQFIAVLIFLIAENGLTIGWQIGRNVAFIVSIAIAGIVFYCIHRVYNSAYKRAMDTWRAANNRHLESLEK